MKPLRNALRRQGREAPISAQRAYCIRRIALGRRLRIPNDERRTPQQKLTRRAEQGRNHESLLHGNSLLVAQCAASIMCDGSDKRWQSAGRTERADRRDDIHGLNDVSPVRAHGGADARSHGIRATLTAASPLSG